MRAIPHASCQPHPPQNRWASAIRGQWPCDFLARRNARSRQPFRHSLPARSHWPGAALAWPACTPTTKPAPNWLCSSRTPGRNAASDRRWRRRPAQAFVRKSRRCEPRGDVAMWRGDSPPAAQPAARPPVGPPPRRPESPRQIAKWQMTPCRPMPAATSRSPASPGPTRQTSSAHSSTTNRLPSPIRT